MAFDCAERNTSCIFSVKRLVSIPDPPKRTGRQGLRRRRHRAPLPPSDGLTCLLYDDKQRVATAVNQQQGGVAAALADSMLKFGHAGDRTAIHFLDNITGAQPCFACPRA